MDDVLVAALAGVVDDAEVAFLDPDGFMETACCKRERMPEPVGGFGEIFWNRGARRVAIIAGGHGPVAGFDPAVMLTLHDVAVGARGRIVGQVGCPFRVMKRVRA